MEARLKSFTKEYTLPAGLARWIVAFPIIIFALFAAAMSCDATQDFAFALVKDNGVIDWLTFLPAFLGGILGVIVAVRARRLGKEQLVWLFYLVFGLGLIFIGGEETSWGQNFYHYTTPSFFDRWNEQGELTLHNLEGMNGENHYLRLAFGVSGLMGLLVWKSGRFRDVAPPKPLQVWFWLIALKSALDIYVTRFAAESMPTYIITELSEIVEMLVAMAGLLYVWLNGRRLAHSSL